MSGKLPQMFGVRQRFAADRLANPTAALQDQLRASTLANQIKAGQQVAIAVGSRGIADIGPLVHTLVEYIRTLGGEPHLIPAMGSHGGGTAAGQQATLVRLGMDPQSLGCPIRATMDTRCIGKTADDIPVYLDINALAADHLVVINRIKPHTMFGGRYQSGLLKMLMIGLGKREGASLYHRAAKTLDFDHLIQTIAPIIFAHRPVAAGIAIIENALDQTADIQLLKQDELLSREPELLVQAQQRMAGLPFDQADLLIVDQIGKEISGTGMDTNVIGRKQSDKQAGPDEYPKISQIYVRGLSEKTGGNAAGIGIAEYCHRRVLDQLDYEATRINALTAGHITAAAVPAHFPSDRAALEAAATQAGLRTGSDLRWLWIRDTLHLDQMVCSEAFLAAAQTHDRLEVTEAPRPLDFDSDENLRPWT